MSHLQKLTVFLIIILAFMGLFQLYKKGIISIGPSYEQLHSQLFFGIHQIPPDQMVHLFPQAKQHPLLVEFQSKYCMDCQKMAPVLDHFRTALLNSKGKVADIPVYQYDISLDRAKNPEVFGAFKPTMVPSVIFIAPGGEIRDVLYGYHTQSELQQSLQKIHPATT